ncbi:hypothetical protein PACILC2_33440 [Paenibacillus cisolokensis]|uniref:Uncharacterized protein n=1 Tax=Paenibacillus cisolokensis TaxID=1658519 RepID=A0ABQ4N9B4_9BACL|nr:hypothetical protein [Paenibacillus cisolokensis]GIQ64776.1 hypothetical protein PACILC2_33440 [Paenibacillus cisolokensis]
MKPAPLIAFVGTTPNIGVTSAAFAFAYRTAEASGKPVGFLCMNLKSAKIHRFLGMDGPSSTLDGLRPELRAGSLTPEKLLHASHRVKGMPNLHVLFGNMLRDQAEFLRRRRPIICLRWPPPPIRSLRWTSGHIGTMPQPSVRCAGPTPACS